MEPGPKDTIGEGLSASPSRNGNQDGPFPRQPQGGSFRFRQWLADLEPRIFRQFVLLRRLARGDDLPGLSKAAILVDWLRAKAGLVQGKGGDGLLRIAGRTWAYGQRCAATGVYQEIFVSRDYEFRSANPAPRILDCGANIGLATLFFKLCYPESRIDAFEVDPNLAALFERNVRDNGLSDVNVHCCALAGAAGEIDFYPHGYSTCGSLYATWGGDKTVRVPAHRLSEWIGDEVDFLKMDIEGAESEVIAELFESGALARVREAVVEYHHNLEGGQAGLARFLDFWERAGFSYQLSAAGDQVTGRPFQYILIRFRRVTDSHG
ncbi:MAG: FkbM family methyltransferase [Methylacidiphilaceae bacterium]|nr:FkbM family methyltransferase [Candidatus Methylacidiphilaceae bacterium]